MVFTVFTALALVVILGSVLTYVFPEMPVDTFRTNVNKLVLFFFLPALNFKVLYAAQIGHEFWQLPILALVCVIVGCLLGALSYSFIKVEARKKGALVLACAFSNVTYFGIAVLQGLFAHDAERVITVAVLFEITITPLVLVVGSSLAAIYSKTGQFSLLNSIGAMLKMPLLWSSFIALALNLTHIHVPQFVVEATNLLASTVSGLMILSLGMALKYPVLFKALKRVQILLPVVVIKLIILPIIIYFCARVLGVVNPYFQAAIIESAMPTQLITLAIADRFDLDIEILAVTIAFDTVLSFVTIPIVHLVLVKLAG